MDYTDILTFDDEGSEAGTTASESTIRAPVSNMNGLSPPSPFPPDQSEPCSLSQSKSASDLQTRRGRYDTGKTLDITSNDLKDLEAFGKISSSRIRSRSSHYRDTPIYTEPGSPLLGQAYYALTQSAPPFSPFDATEPPRSVHDRSNGLTIEEMTQATQRQSPDDDLGDQDSRDTLRSHPYSPPLSAVQDDTGSRISALSFQCVGDLFRDEAAWLRSPLNWWNRRESECLPYVLSQNMPLQRNEDFWSSDNGSCRDEEEDLFACATALAPAKANIINVNGQQTSEFSIQVPPRSSSLGSTVVHPIIDVKAHGSWMTFGDCEDSDFESDDSHSSPQFEMQPHIKPFWQPSLSERGMDLAMPSPPQSPALSSKRDFTTLDFPGGLPHHIKNGSSYPVVSSLEDHISAFPTPMLLADSACTLAIRKCLRTPQNYPPSPAKSDEWMLESYQNDGKTHKEATNDWQLLRKVDTRLFPDPDLEPLRKVFPDTSNFMRSALYAHLLSYIFVTSIPIACLPSRGRPLGHQQHASVSSIPPKAASLLGMDEAGSHQNSGSNESDTELLKSRLRENIERIISGMDGSFDFGGSRFGQSSGISPAFFRSLIEVVRLIEGL